MNPIYYTLYSTVNDCFYNVKGNDILLGDVPFHYGWTALIEAIASMSHGGTFLEHVYVIPFGDDHKIPDCDEMMTITDFLIDRDCVGILLRAQ